MTMEQKYNAHLKRREDMANDWLQQLWLNNGLSIPTAIRITLARRCTSSACTAPSSIWASRTGPPLH